MQIKCPRCETSIPVDPESRDDAGRVRLRCPDCDAKLLIKVKAPPLKVDDAIPPTEQEPNGGDEEAARLPGLGDIVIDTGAARDDEEDDANGDEGPWMLLVIDLPYLEVGELRRLMMRIPRFSRNPNKLHDLTNELPFTLGGITEAEAVRLETSVLGMGGTCRSGPEAELLDSSGRPQLEDDPDEFLPEPGLLVAGDEDDDPDEVDEGLLVAGDEEDEEDEEEHDSGVPVVPEAPASWSLPTEHPLPPLDPEPAPISADDPDSVSLSMVPLAAEPSPVLPPAKVAPVEPPVARTEAPAPEPRRPAPEPRRPTPEPRRPTPEPRRPTPEPHRPTPANGLVLATVDQLPGAGELIGLVTASVVVSARDLGSGSQAASLAAALKRAEDDLRSEAKGRGAKAVVGVATTSAALPDGSLLLVMQGTATA